MSALAPHMRNKCPKESPGQCYLCGAIGSSRKDDDECLDELFMFMPSFRSELMVAAQAMDIDRGGEGADKHPHGKAAQAVKDALGEMPQELQALQDITLPVDKSWQPVEPIVEASNEHNAVSVEEMSDEMKNFFK